MAKGTLTFDLPEEREEFELAQKGAKLSADISDFDNWLRGKLKYETLTELEYEIYEAVRKKLWECINE